MGERIKLLSTNKGVSKDSFFKRIIINFKSMILLKNKVNYNEVISTKQVLKRPLASEKPITFASREWGEG
jgi:hypothetical protein